MPFRARIKRAFGRSDKEDPRGPAPPLLPVLDEPARTPKADTVSDADPPSAVSSPLSTSLPQSPPGCSTTAPEDSHILGLQDLWNDSYNELEEEEPSLVAAYEQSLINAQDDQPESSSNTATERQEDLQHLVQRRLDEIENSRLKVLVGGREIAVRDQARRVVRAVLSVKEMIDVAVSVEPHASLAWAGVLVFLNVRFYSQLRQRFMLTINSLLRMRLRRMKMPWGGSSIYRTFSSASR